VLGGNSKHHLWALYRSPGTTPEGLGGSRRGGGAGGGGYCQNRS